MNRNRSRLASLCRTVALWSIAVGITLVPIEIFLRIFHDTLPQPLSNFLATGYHLGLTGIYNYSPEMHMPVMKPNFQRNMYFNGYRWHHKTDSMGFRNPDDRSRADVVLLGDSMIYGHGLEEQYGVRSQLEKLIRRPVNNLGIQGGSAHQEFQIMKKYAINLKPKLIFLFFLGNDIEDLEIHLTDAEMRRFLDYPIDSIDLQYFKIYPQPILDRFTNGYLRDSYVTAATYAALRLLWKHTLQDAAASGHDWDSIPLFSEYPKRKLAMQFHLAALKKMHLIAQDNDIFFVNVFIYTGQYLYLRAEDTYEQILKAYCISQKIPFLSFRSIFVHRMEQGDALFLERDGHFSERGASLAAQVLADHMNKMGASSGQ